MRSSSATSSARRRRTWDEHGRPDDLLWTGSAYREYSVWRERYPGGLDRDRGGVCRGHDHARRPAAPATPSRWWRSHSLLLVAGLAVVGSFWRRSVREARRAEAANLFALAQLQLEDHPTATIAYAIASLELADNPEVRRLALEALWRGPTETRLDNPRPLSRSVLAPMAAGWRRPALTTVSCSGHRTAVPRPPSRAVTLPWRSGSARGAISSRPTRTRRGRRSDSGRSRRGASSARSHSAIRVIPTSFRSPPTANACSRTPKSRLENSCTLEFRSWPVAGGEPDLLAHLDLPACPARPGPASTRPGLVSAGPMAARSASHGWTARPRSWHPRPRWNTSGPLRP